MTLDEFILRHKTTAIRIINAFKTRSLLDSHDINEVIYQCLWIAYRKHDPARASLNTFLSTVIRNYINSLLSKVKFRRITQNSKQPHYLQRGEVPLMQFVRVSESGKIVNLNYDSSLHELCTESEWEFIKPLTEGHTLRDSAKICKLSTEVYSKFVKTIGNRIKQRMEK